MEYVPVKGYEDLFKITKCASVMSVRTGKILKQHVRKDKRVTIATKVGGRSGKNLTLKIHRMVAETFIPNFENKPQVNHIDGDTTNNCVSNLEWVTGSENVKHAYNTGLATQRKGIDSPLSITKEQLDYILTSKEVSRVVGSKLNLSHVVVNKYRKIYGV